MEYQNRLAKAASPYLQQHANNPVDWFEWGEEALKKAENENKLLIISIGYSACHWCHVMEKECFMDEDVAALMNAYFVSVKVDREERPDIDQIYIEAAQMLNGNAGWPLNIFALPDGKPFFAGTYFPKPQWINILSQLNQIYREDNQRIYDQAERLTEGIQQDILLTQTVQENTVFNASILEGMITEYLNQVDFEKGGFKSQQKFPMTINWDFLLQYYHFSKNKKVEQALKITLKEMAYGGLYDQLGGGFSRYTVDSDWFVPHFEKMLYDNAQLISLYAKAYQKFKTPFYKNIVKESLAFVQRELTSENGGFYSALNADSEGEEGKFYIWNYTEIETTLSTEEFELFKTFYQIKPEGNWENGQNILHRKSSLKAFAETQNKTTDEVSEILNKARKKLLKVRSNRVRPSTDDKILTAWNAMMITAYVDAYKSLGDETYLEKALANAAFIKQNMWAGQTNLKRNFKDGKTSIQAFLDDYAFLAEAFLNLYEVTFDKTFIENAERLVNMAYQHFFDRTHNLFYYTSNQAERLIARKKEIVDNVIPSSNAVMTHVLFRLGTILTEEKWIVTAQNMLQKMKPNLLKGSIYFSKWNQALFYEIQPPYQLVIMGENAVKKSRLLQQNYYPQVIMMGGNAENLPLLEGKLKRGQTLLYLCQNKTCQAPTDKIEEIMESV